MTSKIVRIDGGLAEEIDRIARENKIKFVEASREIEKFIKQSKNKKTIREIQF